MNTRIALTRPIEDAQRSATLLRASGYEPVIAPVMRLVATAARPPDGRFDGLLATSANAFAFLPPESHSALSGLKLYVVGERTAAAANAMGLGEADETGADALSLAASLAERLPPASRLLYLAARDRKSDLEILLRAAGHEVVAVEVYSAEARSAWSAAEAAEIATCAVMLHYSRRSSQLAIVLAERAGLGDHLRATLHGCISKDAAEPLRSIGAERIVTATGAQESLLIDALSSAAKAF